LQKHCAGDLIDIDHPPPLSLYSLRETRRNSQSITLSGIKLLPESALHIVQNPV